MMKIPRTGLNLEPYISPVIDTDDSILSIGDNEEFEDIFFELEVPEYIKIVCELIPKYDFPKINISFDMLDYNGNNIHKTFELYNDSNQFISGIDIKLKESTQKITGLPIGKIIFSKNFKTQTKDSYLEMFKSEYSLQTKAFYYGGKFSSYFTLGEIQPCLFYVKCNQYSELRIESISEILRKNKIQLSEEIDMRDISSLEDDILNGKINITLPTGHSYKSIASKKTNLNNFAYIIFKLNNFIV